MASTVTATLTVQFTSDSADSLLKLEIDGRAGGLNGGKTSFSPGDSVYYLKYKTSDVTELAHVASAGSISGAGTGSTAQEEYIVITSQNTSGNVSYPISSGWTYQWLGNNLGQVKRVGETGWRLASSITNTDVGVLKVNYNAAFSAYRLSAVDLNIDQVAIVVVGEA